MKRKIRNKENTLLPRSLTRYPFTFEHIIQTLVWTLTGSVIAATICLFLNALVYVTTVVFIAASVILYPIVYHFTHSSVFSIALRLDKHYRTHEKITTMLHFQNQNGPIIDAQRKDTQRTLNNLTSTLPQKPRMKINPLSLLLLASATAFCAGGCAYNTSQRAAATQPPSIIIKEDKDEPNPDFVEKINDIVSNSNPENPKATEDEINKALNDENTNEEIGSSLQQTATDAALQKLGEAIKNNDKEAISAAIEDLKKELQNLSGEELANKLQQIADEIRKALKESPMKEDDLTRKALENLADTFEELAKDAREDENKDEDSHQKANDALDKASDELQKSADEEEANKTVAEEAKEELKNQGSENQGSENQGGENQGGENQGEGGAAKTGEIYGSSQGSTSGSGSGAGAGNGDTIYRGKDHVYTKDGGEQEYGDIIDESHNSAIEDDRKTNDNNGATDDDDFSDLLDKYYDYLYDGTQKP